MNFVFLLVHTEKQFVLNEVKLKLYSKGSYLMSKFIYSIPQTCVVYISFALPACSMAGLQNNLPIYLLIMLGYLFSLRIITLAAAWTFNKRSTAAIGLGFILSIIFLTSGTTFHHKDLSIATRWMSLLSTTRWTHEALIGWEFDNNSTSSPPYLCSRNPIVQQPNAILVRADCGFQSKANIMKWFRYKGGLPTGTSGSPTGPSLRSFWHPVVSYSIVIVVFLVISCLSFCLLAKRKYQNKNNKLI